jgi:CheY-specific phosphatase CheX
VAKLARSILDIIANLQARTASYLGEDISIEVGEKRTLLSLEELKLKNITTIIRGTGVLGGAFLFSCDKSLALKIVHAFVFGEVSLEEEEALIEECLNEVLNIVLGNALVNCAYGAHEIGFETPFATREMEKIPDLYASIIGQEAQTPSGSYVIAYLYT